MASKDMKLKEEKQNFVRIDGVVKEQVRLEDFTRNRYAERWSIVLDFDKICLEIAKEEGFGEREFRRMAARCTKRKKLPPAVADDWKLPSSGPMPKTTTGEVGRRGANAECNLELYGPLYRTPKETMIPIYEPANVIFLG